ncbi:MAG: hypothetical protein K9W44_17605 [Candidatus Lokiarchaeota archaeon]|nr:hypothetical protein [Candidatus Harpocratesius repetitus]
MSTKNTTWEISPQLKTLIIPCSRCRHLKKIEFLQLDQIFMECECYQIKDTLTELIKFSRVCEHYSESLKQLKEILKSDNNSNIRK